MSCGKVRLLAWFASSRFQSSSACSRERTPWLAAQSRSFLDIFICRSNTGSPNDTSQRPLYLGFTLRLLMILIIALNSMPSASSANRLTTASILSAG
jgi:hypothetical protein